MGCLRYEVDTLLDPTALSTLRHQIVTTTQTTRLASRK